MLLGDAITSCLVAALLGSFVVLALRYVFYVAVFERIRLYLRRRGPGFEMYTPVVTEELWEGLGSTVLVALGSAALWLGHNDRCHPGDTRGCLRGWPQQHVVGEGTPWTVDALLLAQIAWYTQCTTKHWFGLGRLQGLDTALHHAFSLCLLALAYSLELHRVSLLAHWLFVVTNPLLSASKILHCIDMRPRALKKALFVFFVLAYFATRVIAVPVVLLPCTLYDAWTIPLDRRAAVVGNALLVLLYGLSLFWFGRLLGILFTGKLDSTPRMALVTAPRDSRGRKWHKQL
ncbi:hypothetical protein HYH03_012653 [Edaphochlamys debaryana]|uniref:TLC domain-containing protein n=1 Tax=Edaphochlamys debaryana TaxID=47281 RepID=A0A835XSI2_9CHLO|nr:hypothetical protein HYH03_012653 [Edaphochlamys debaryana]|eukprot:KAG2488857.1 hypothetical protein HYH03_012653 [Edaphochlamys debaryana]